MIEYVNRAFTKITGYNRKEALGQNPRILKSGKHPERFYKKMWDTILKGKIWHDKIVNKKKNGELFIANLSITPMRNKEGVISHFVAIQVDITHQEATLRELHETLDKLHHLSAYMNTMVETEKKTIARNLHDNLGQLLTAVKMDISWFSRELPESDEKIKHRLEETKGLVEEAMKTVQWITYELRPSLLDELGLWDALESLFEESSKRSGIRIEAARLPRKLLLPEDYVLPVYRVIQEAVTNIIRHANASAATLQAVRKGNKIVFSLRDNGTGIEEEKIDSSSSFGLMSMKERIELLGGKLKIHSLKEGTEVLFTLPWPNHKRS